MAPLILLVASLSVAGVTRAPIHPYVLVLGTAQDGGLPQVGCSEARCARARRRPSARRLVDATPDLPEQVERAKGHPATRKPEGARPPLFDGIFLTHAHVGHYAGLIHLGREAYGARELPVFATERLRAFLTSNGPWDLLVSAGHVRLEPLIPDVAVELGGGLSVTPFLVPHRDEYSDTVGFRIAGPSRTVLYVPDIDKWERWDRRIEDEIAGVDVALLDGTFFEDDEVHGRAMKDIPHPFVVESLERFAALPAEEQAKILFTHLNHTNPAADRRGPAVRRIRKAGLGVASEDLVLPL